jgi:hypothetical protein
MKENWGPIALVGVLSACVGSFIVHDARIREADRKWGRSKDCAAQAERRFLSDGFKSAYDPKTESSASFTNHFDPNRGQCFMEVVSINGLTNSRSVLDAFEGKEYGGYMFVGTSGKKYEDTRPIDCYMLTATGEKKYCKSGEEFDEMALAFMAEKAAPPK